MKKIIALVLVALLMLGGCTQASAPSNTGQRPEADSGQSASPEVTPTATPEPTPGPTPEPAPKQTTGQKNALRSAESYLNVMAFSYEGLIKQLEYEKYSHEDAVYAADNCGADWNEQAAKSAESYLSVIAFSRDGLIEQLEYEGFTHAQAVYGAEANGY